ncbi:MAG: restriction endonuclease, partial [Oscillospiraceae bacterium]
LDLIRGSYLPSNVDDMKLGQDKRPPMPFSDARLLNVLSHTFWFLPNVASCEAMANLLKQKQNAFYHDYKINVCAGVSAGIGINALEPVRKSMGNPLETKTITLSCGKLTTGVTVKPWTGIFMLRNLKSPETYFQAAFRVQSPWAVKTSSNRDEIMKNECYVFDFALDRALKQIADYSCRLNVDESNPEKKVGEFIGFLPVLAYDGSSMKQIDAQDILDIAMSGTSATLLAKRWESALLVNVDNETLARLMANKEAMDALMKIEGFRSLNSDIETIINKSEFVKKAKKDDQDKLTPKEKKELTDEEKEYKSMRKQIQEKLIKFATRVPIFMYLTDYRERSLKDVITQLEPGLFKKVTGLDVNDFNLLVSLNV